MANWRPGRNDTQIQCGQLQVLWSQQYHYCKTRSYPVTCTSRSICSYDIYSPCPSSLDMKSIFQIGTFEAAPDSLNFISTWTEPATWFNKQLKVPTDNPLLFGSKLRLGVLEVRPAIPTCMRFVKTFNNQTKRDLKLSETTLLIVFTALGLNWRVLMIQLPLGCPFHHL